MKLPYNADDKKSIIEYAKQLTGKTLREVCNTASLGKNKKGKGNFGQILEEYYFHYKPNAESGPDFPVAGLELKSSPMKRLQDSSLRSKERLVLSIINYSDVVRQDFESSSFLKKNTNLLLVFYLHEVDSDILDYLIILVDEWHFPETDLEIIKRDWEYIKNKVAAGKAHELSEGDTFYLGACTKGANAGTRRKQPFSDTPAKQRAFSLKQGYVNHIIATIANDTAGRYGKLLPTADLARSKTIEEVVLDRFKPFYGMSTEQIIAATGANLNQNAKSFYADLTKAILGISQEKEIEEFEKAEIIVRSIRVESDDRIVESISFKQFEYVNLAEERWEDSGLKDILEHKFLFIFFKGTGKDRVLQKIRFWNMPYKDMMEARKVWAHTKKMVRSGTIVREIKPNGTRKTNFMGKSDNPVSHVRPHAAKAADTYPLPTRDKFTGEREYTKYSFWLNNSYVRDEIYLK